mmetsp:Transcript_25023/g.29483  ORF Transcript_25023/g.29483 Transcript_25023/m.29483 type:complete len:216 (-) Transcript_25023:350-997(-)
MKISPVHYLTITCIAGKSAAFVVPQQGHSTPATSIIRLDATGTKSRWWKPALSGGMMGWVLATKIATASSIPQDIILPIEYPQLQEAFPTTIIAEGAYQPESGYESLNMDMPSYSIKKSTKFEGEGAGNEEIPEKRSAAQVKAKTKSLADVEKSKAKVKAAKEEANIKEYVEKQQSRSKEKAEKERIKAKIDAERLDAKEKQIADRAAREKGDGN